ncbi:hypothetical protein FOCG_10118 [Fusarium oxysporum f. sp. radicis-lycopersici 26381]|nr:hypothetical protein FOCG_10118 [Fusarium oxysporum f. sp. radicis-lycopersici 26381]
MAVARVMQRYLSCTCDNHVRSWLRNGICEWQLAIGFGPADPGHELEKENMIGNDEKDMLQRNENLSLPYQ